MSDALPFDGNQRALSYMRGSNRFDTSAQVRRRKHKLGHLAAYERAHGVGSVKTKQPCRATDDENTCIRWKPHSGYHRAKNGHYWQ
jgi:hypothetical protein